MAFKRGPALGSGPDITLARGRETLLALGEDLEHVPVEKIRPNPYQPRTVFDEDALDELAASIQRLGFIHPLAVVRDEDGYTLVSGERRLRAAERAGLTTVPVTVKTYTDEEMEDAALEENVHRENIDPIDEAEAYRNYMLRRNCTQEEVAQKVGKNQTHISRYIKFLNLPEDIQNFMRRRIISPAHASELVKIEDPEKVREMASRIVEGDLTSKDIRVKVSKPRPKHDPTEDEILFSRHLEEEFGVRVRCSRGARSQILVTYRTPQDLRRWLKQFRDDSGSP